MNTEPNPIIYKVHVAVTVQAVDFQAAVDIVEGELNDCTALDFDTTLVEVA